MCCNVLSKILCGKLLLLLWLLPAPRLVNKMLLLLLVALVLFGLLMMPVTCCCLLELFELVLLMLLFEWLGLGLLFVGVTDPRFKALKFKFMFKGNLPKLAGLLCAREWWIAKPLGIADGATIGVITFWPTPAPIVVPDPKAESAEFSRECETEGDLEPDDGGLKKEAGNLRI